MMGFYAFHEYRPLDQILEMASDNHNGELTMQTESFINLINNNNYYALWEIPNGEVKLIKAKLDYNEKTFKYHNRNITYAICTNLYECEDGFVMVSGVCYIEEDTYALPRDIGVKCRAILCKFPNDEVPECYTDRVVGTTMEDAKRLAWDKSSRPEAMSGTMTVNLADGVSIKRLFGNGVPPEPKLAPHKPEQEPDDEPEQEPEQEPEHPDYYKGDNEDGKAIEVFDVIDQFVGGDFYLGNVLKYVCRAGKKSKETKKQDLEKALHYIKEAIKRS